MSVPGPGGVNKTRARGPMVIHAFHIKTLMDPNSDVKIKQSILRGIGAGVDLTRLGKDDLRLLRMTVAELIKNPDLAEDARAALTKLSPTPPPPPVPAAAPAKGPDPDEAMTTLSPASLGLSITPSPKAAEPVSDEAPTKPGAERKAKAAAEAPAKPGDKGKAKSAAEINDDCRTLVQDVKNIAMSPEEKAKLLDRIAVIPELVKSNAAKNRALFEIRNVIQTLLKEPKMKPVTRDFLLKGLLQTIEEAITS